MPQATQADPQHIQELEQRLQQHQSDAISIDQQVGLLHHKCFAFHPTTAPCPGIVYALGMTAAWWCCLLVGTSAQCSLSISTVFLQTMILFQLNIRTQWSATELCTSAQAISNMHTVTAAPHSGS